jgi:hypothetical protein
LSHQEQLDWERRAARPAAAAAFASAILGMAALAVGAKAHLLSPVSDRAEDLIRQHKHAGAYATYAIIQALSILAIAPVLAFIYRAAKYRRPEIPKVALYLALAAPPLVAVLSVVSAFQTLDIADKFVHLPTSGSPAQAVHRAEDLGKQGGNTAVGALALFSGLSLAFALGFNSINARRAGLLSQFMGILGVIVGVLLVIPILGPPIVQVFWFVAIGLLLLDRWPGGRKRGPAWETGEADPWPTAADIRAEQMAERGEVPPPRRGRAKDPEPEPDEDEYEDDGYQDDGAPVATSHPRSKKRKRKRRR